MVLREVVLGRVREGDVLTSDRIAYREPAGSERQDQTVDRAKDRFVSRGEGELE